VHGGERRLVGRRVKWGSKTRRLRGAFISLGRSSRLSFSSLLEIGTRPAAFAQLAIVLY
jgi:hypothetical protein